jgi:hypothetical protein
LGVVTEIILGSTARFSDPWALGVPGRASSQGTVSEFCKLFRIYRQGQEREEKRRENMNEEQWKMGRDEKENIKSKRSKMGARIT